MTMPAVNRQPAALTNERTGVSENGPVSISGAWCLQALAGLLGTASTAGRGATARAAGRPRCCNRGCIGEKAWARASPRTILTAVRMQ